MRSQICHRFLLYFLYKTKQKEKILNFLKEKGLECRSDRHILNGREIDIKSYSLGYIYDEESNFNYFISPRWCRELKEDK